ncbi:TPA: fimbrial protein [Salmonella enterica]|nr:fimbrial protein [Salmonella enterica]
MKWLNNLFKYILLSGICLTAIITPLVHAAGCTGTGDTNISLPNINYKSSKVPPIGQVLYTSPPYTIRYTCSPPFGYDGRPTLAKTGDFGLMKNAFNNAGLGLNITIQEQGQPAVTYSWDDMQWTTKEFGTLLNGTETRTATFTLSLFVNRTTNNVMFTDIPAMNSFRIIAYKQDLGSTPVNIHSSPFSIRYIPDNFGSVSIYPSSQISLGHIYTDYPVGSRRVSFAVVASQSYMGGGITNDYNLPLNVTFTVNGNPLTDAGQSIMLTTSGGQPNGLKLSLLDGETGPRLTFGQVTSLGSIIARPGVAPSSPKKTYTALLETIPGQPLKTGPFSADVVVTVTYN